ncbi:PGF-CTERM sorting domain-containing protein [Halopenitus malekzadehii]|uniref:PGF-CTERM sorting domain-containing protein n=1 Tax=Halopenitus malekzadehii TaxID=1267564 RepID=UPI00115FB2B0
MHRPLRSTRRRPPRRPTRSGSGTRSDGSTEFGETTIEFGGKRVSLTVTEDREGTADGDSAAGGSTDVGSGSDTRTDEGVPGFGPVVAIVVLLLASILVAARTRRS